MMKSGTKDQIKGKAHEVAGATKSKAGKATGNPRLKAEGEDQKLGGKVQKKVGQVKRVFNA
jgi:uncharacterized protein YjbJ (UPF0337 family)